MVAVGQENRFLQYFDLALGIAYRIAANNASNIRIKREMKENG